MTNGGLELCQKLVNIPTAEAYSSLNISQAVQWLSYEILMANQQAKPNKAAETENTQIDVKDTIATNDELEGMYDHFVDALTSLKFFGSRNPEHVMRKIRCLYGRARPTKREVQIMRGVLSYTQGRRTQTSEEDLAEEIANKE